MPGSLLENRSCSRCRGAKRFLAACAAGSAPPRQPGPGMALRCRWLSWRRRPALHGTANHEFLEIWPTPIASTIAASQVRALIDFLAEKPEVMTLI